MILTENDDTIYQKGPPKSNEKNFECSIAHFSKVYLGKSYVRVEAGQELDPNMVSYAAAVSIILGSKLHESNGELTLVRTSIHRLHPTPSPPIHTW